jgi:hypothetical protein
MIGAIQEDSTTNHGVYKQHFKAFSQKPTLKSNRPNTWVYLCMVQQIAHWRILDKGLPYWIKIYPIETHGLWLYSTIHLGNVYINCMCTYVMVSMNITSWIAMLLVLTSFRTYIQWLQLIPKATLDTPFKPHLVLLAYCESWSECYYELHLPFFIQFNVKVMMSWPTTSELAMGMVHGSFQHKIFGYNHKVKHYPFLRDNT